MSLTLKTKVGDTSTWTMTLKEDGSAKDLTAASTVKIYTRKYGETALTTDGRSCVVSNATAGTVVYTPISADVLVPGIFEVEVKVTWNDASVSKFPSDGFGRLEIDAALG